MLITVSIQSPMKAGESFGTPFGVKTVTEAEAASGYYNKTVSQSRFVSSEVDALALASHGADLVAGLATQVQD